LPTVSSALPCFHFSPPKAATATEAERTYTANALYRDSKGVVQQGPGGSFAVLGGPPPAPNAPKELKLTKNANGSVTLTWPASSTPPEVAFYRIYRGSTDYTSRYAATGSASTTSYTDGDAEVTHTYWVTAVRANLSESPFVGPVTG
jgi:hypothetical protein